MQEIINTLQDFSTRADLWTLTRKNAFEALDKYFQDTKSERLFQGLTSKNFMFQNHSQSLVFWQRDNTTFILRTTISIARDNNPNMFIVGEYSLDVDSDADVVDDSLVFY